MSFFDRVDEMQIVEQHIQEVLALEESEAKRLLRRYTEARTELRARLRRFPKETFSAQQLRGVLAQIDAAIIAMRQGLKEGMAEAAPGAALLGVEHQLDEIRAFSREFEGAVVPIDIDTQMVATETSNFLINRYEASLDAYSEGLRAQIARSLSIEMLGQSSLSKLVENMGAADGISTFFVGEEWKLHRIARTELHNVYGMGKMNGMLETREQVLPDLMKTLMHPMDARTGDDSKYAARRNLIAALDEPFRYRWDGKERVFMHPPDRPNDRSILVPYRSAWGR